jgi:hypothetical protein
MLLSLCLTSALNLVPLNKLQICFFLVIHNPSHLTNRIFALSVISTYLTKPQLCSFHLL